MSKLIKEEMLNSKKYELTKTGDLIDITPDNVALVEAMIRTDSGYKKDSDPNAGPSRKYKGSTPYHIKQLVNCNNINDYATYFKLIRSIISSIDTENSTHLNSDMAGIDELTGRICAIPYEELIELLKNPKKDNYKLVSILSEKTHPANVDVYKARVNYSFATKFCHYMCFYLFADEEAADNFSIYDNVMDRNIRRYMQNKVKKDYFKCHYDRYIAEIDKIIEKYGNKVSRNGFDHLLWYGYKGY